MGAYKDGNRVDLQMAGGEKCKTFELDFANNYNNYRVRTIAATGSQRFTFCIPDDFNSLVSLEAVGAPTGGAGGVGKDIDRYSDYGAVGESTTQHSEADTTSTYDTGTDDNWEAIDLSSVFSSLNAGDICGVLVDHKSIGGAINYARIILKYT